MGEEPMGTCQGIPGGKGRGSKAGEWAVKKTTKVKGEGNSGFGREQTLGKS